MTYFWPHSLTIASPFPPPSPPPPFPVCNVDLGLVLIARKLFVTQKLIQNLQCCFLISQICKPKWTISGEISILKAKYSLTPFFHRALQLVVQLLLTQAITFSKWAIDIETKKRKAKRNQIKCTYNIFLLHVILTLLLGLNVVISLSLTLCSTSLRT